MLITKILLSGSAKGNNTNIKGYNEMQILLRTYVAIACVEMVNIEKLSCFNLVRLINFLCKVMLYMKSVWINLTTYPQS